MGYTHYFDNVKMNQKIADDAAAIVEASDVAIHGWDGTGKPVISATEIRLNGSEELGEDYETFAIGSEGAWAFCKTARSPYDEVVTAILVSVMVNDSSAKINSDGTFDDWADGIALYEKAVRSLTDDELLRVKNTLG